MFLCLHGAAQELLKNSKIFVSVYKNEGQKIAKEKILNTTDDALILKKGSSSITIPTTDIMYIKTKKTNGHNVLIGGVAGARFVLGLGFGGNGFIAICLILNTKKVSAKILNFN